MTRRLTPLALTLDIVGAVLLLVITVPFSLSLYTAGGFAFVGDSASRGVVLLLAAAVVQCGAVAVRRYSPGIALAIAWVGAILQMAGGLTPLPVNAAILIVLYATAAWGSLRIMWAGLVSVGAGALIAGVYIAIINYPSSGLGITFTTAVLLGLASALALGLSWASGFGWRMVLRARRIRGEQERAEAMAAEEQERVRIARDMHDIVAHSLAVIIAQADGARYAASVDPDAASTSLVTIGQTARGALSDVRMLLTQLRHRQGEGPQPTLADLETLFAQVRASGIEPRITVDPLPPGEPPASIQLAVFRILQEALTNVIRHSGSRTVDIRLSWLPDRVEIEVGNDVDAGTIAAHGGGTGGGHGIIGMRERAQLVGGLLRAEREAGRFVVRARLPIAPGAVPAASAAPAAEGGEA